MKDYTIGIIFLLLGILLAGVIIVEMRGCGPTLADKINEGICHHLGGAWDNKNYTCILEQ